MNNSYGMASACYIYQLTNNITTVKGTHFDRTNQLSRLTQGTVTDVSFMNRFTISLSKQKAAHTLIKLNETKYIY